MEKTQPENSRYKVKFDERKLTRLNFLIGLLVIVIILFLLFRFVVGISRVDGTSMSPTLADGQTVVYTRIIPNLEVGDIVAIDMPSGEFYIKRIIAGPGDVVDIRGNYCYVNGEEESTAEDAAGRTMIESRQIQFPYTVGEDMYFVMGDNREGSVDSRTFGAITKAQVLGKVIGGS